MSGARGLEERVRREEDDVLVCVQAAPVKGLNNLLRGVLEAAPAEIAFLRCKPGGGSNVK